MLDERPVQEAGQMLRAANRVLIVCHIRPDGDAIGSLLGLGLSLSAAGKQVKMLSPDGVPPGLRHLARTSSVTQEARGVFDVVVTVDCSDLRRTGDGIPPGRQPDLNLDHHATNLNYARLNLVDAQAAATAELLCNCLPVWGFPIPLHAASALLTGILTDTLGFRTPNTTPATLRHAAALVESGANLMELYQRALVERSYEAVRFWGAGLSHIERENRIVWTSLSTAERRAVGYNGKDDADLINILASINQTDVSIIFVEQPGGSVKVSWRSIPGIDVSRVALQFGGGGHPVAAGADIPGSLEAVQNIVLTETRKLLANYAAPSHKI